ncbi:hypothetical protein TELCIR_08263 [Teladorsagia circumcincta]|uniref:Uncharacterized protein n=1 Tax=Teladorsagia circumcincta TaxID=45464 RepID=A0A2G9UI34_TELCI|nr:hypothetical protein TELCIR_08263 [Teladorsagia circumcincta]
MLLKAEPSHSKTLVVVHNGRTTNCLNGEDNPTVFAYAEREIAINMRKAGVRIIYVSVNEYDFANVRAISGGIQHTLSLKGYTNLSIRVGHHVMTRFCDSTVDS